MAFDYPAFARMVSPNPAELGATLGAIQVSVNSSGPQSGGHVSGKGLKYGADRGGNSQG